MLLDIDINGEAIAIGMVIFIAIALPIQYLIHKDETKNGKTLIRKKYRAVITKLMSPDGPTETFIDRDDHYVFGSINGGGSTKFSFMELDGLLHIRWTVEKSILGRHELAWKFPLTTSTDDILYRIRRDLEDYNNKLGSKRAAPPKPNPTVLKSEAVVNEETLWQRYRVLIEVLLGSPVPSKAATNSQSKIQFGGATNGGHAQYLLFETALKSVGIIWTYTGTYFGKTSLDWVFPSYSNLGQMAVKIKQDIAQHMVTKMADADFRKNMMLDRLAINNPEMFDIISKGDDETLSALAKGVFDTIHPGRDRMI